MKLKDRIFAIIVLLLGFLAISNGMKAQKITQKGNTFISVQSDSSTKSETKTKYTFITPDGKEYPVYLSKNSKTFIYRISKKTGKKYKQYLPEVTKRLSKRSDGKKSN